MAEGFDLWTTLRLKDEGVETTLSKVGHAAQGAREGLGGVEKGVKGLQIGLGHLLGLAGIGGLYATLEKGARAAADAEEGMAKLQTRMEAGQDASAMYGAGIREIEKQYGTAGGELRAGMYDIIAAGTAQTDAMRLLQAANKMAIGGFTDVKTSVSGLTTVMNAYGMSGEKADYVANTFAVTQKRSKASIGELSAAVQDLAKPGAMSNVQFEDLATTLAVATRNGVSLGTATGGLKGILDSLATGGGRAGAMLKKAGITDWGKASIETRGFVGTLAYLNERLGGNAAQMRKVLGSTEGYTLALQLLGTKGRQEFDSLAREIHTDTQQLTRDVAIMESTSADKLEDMTQAFNRAFEALGAGFFDAIGFKSGDTAEKIVEFADEAGHAIGEFFKDFDYYSTQAERLLGILLAYKGAAAATAFIGGLGAAKAAAAAAAAAGGGAVSAAGGGAAVAAGGGMLAKGIGLAAGGFIVYEVAKIVAGTIEAGQITGLEAYAKGKFGLTDVEAAARSVGGSGTLSAANRLASADLLAQRAAIVARTQETTYDVDAEMKLGNVVPTMAAEAAMDELEKFDASIWSVYSGRRGKIMKQIADNLAAIDESSARASEGFTNAGDFLDAMGGPAKPMEVSIALKADITSKSDKDQKATGSVKARIDRGEGEARLVSPEFRMTLVREGAGGLVVHPLEDHVIDLAMLGGRS